MRKHGIKVLVDYTNGAYDVAGNSKGEFFAIRKPIINRKEKGFLRSNFSNFLTRLKRRRIINRLNEMQNEIPDFKYSKKLVKKVDPMLWEILTEWDEVSDTNYADNYLETITKKFDVKNKPLTDDQYRQLRATHLRRCGLDISYNVGMLNTCRDLRFIDKIRGIRYANAQNEVLGVRINNSFVLKPNYYLRDMDRFVIDLEEEEYGYRRQGEYKDEAQMYANLMKQKQEESELLVAVSKKVQTIMDENKQQKELELESSKKIQAAIDAKKEEEVLSEIVKDLEEPPIDWEDGWEDISTVKSENSDEAEIHEASEVVEEKILEKVIVPPHIDQSEPQNKHYTNKGAKQGLHRRQKIQLQKRAQREQNSYRNVRMEALKRGETNKAKLENEESIVPENTEAELIAEPKLDESKESPAAEQPKSVKPESKEPERVFNTDHIERKFHDVSNAIKNSKYIPKTSDINRRINEFNSSSKLGRRINAEIRHWGRKINNVSDSIKNKKFVHKPLNSSKTIKKPDFSHIKRKIDVSVRSFKRKINGISDSIRNKKYKSHLSEKGKKILIVGFATALSIGILFAGGHLFKNTGKDINVDPTPIVVTIDENEDDNTLKGPQTPTASVKEKDNEEATTAPVKEESNESATTAPVKEENDEETETNIEDDKEQKIIELQEEAQNLYRDAIVIGETPNIGNVLEGQCVSENPDGTGIKEELSNHPNYMVEFINVITEDGWHTVRLEGKSLTEVLAEFPNYITYNVHLVDKDLRTYDENGEIDNEGWLGFITKEQYEQAVNEKVKNIIDSRSEKLEDDLMR